MSSVITDPKQHTAALDALRASLADVADGSKVTDEDALLALMTDQKTALRQGITEERKATNLANKLGRNRVAAREICVGSDGNPSWSMAVVPDSYRLTVEATEGEVWATTTSSEKRAFDGRIRQQIRRNLLEPAIVAYVLRTMTDAPKVGDMKWTTETPTAPSVPTGDIVKEQPKFAAAVKAEYVRCNIDCPEKFGGTRTNDGQNPGPKKNDPANAAAVFTSAAPAAVEHVTADVVADSLHRLVSSLWDAAHTKEGLKYGAGKDATVASLQNVATVADALAQFLSGKKVDEAQPLWVKVEQQ